MRDGVKKKPPERMVVFPVSGKRILPPFAKAAKSGAPRLLILIRASVFLESSGKVGHPPTRVTNRRALTGVI